MGSALQKSLGRWMVLLALGFATTTMLVVSVRANYLFGYQLGQTQEKQQLFAWANVAADIWKAFGLIAISMLWRQRHWGTALAASMAWVVCLISGVNSAIGVYVHDRATMTGARESRHAAYLDAKKQLANLEHKMSGLARHRAAAEVEALIAETFARAIYVGERVRGTVASLSDHCVKADTRTARACGEIGRLRSELASARESERLSLHMQELRRRIEDLEAVGNVPADPIGEFYAWITRGFFSVRDVGFGFPLFFALLIEVVSAFGPIGIAGYAQASRHADDDAAGHDLVRPALSGSGGQQPAAVALIVSDHGRIEDWMAERAAPSSDQSAVTLQLLYHDYRSWCADAKLAELAKTVFEVELDRLRQMPELDGKIKKFSGRYYGVKLVDIGRDASRRQ